MKISSLFKKKRLFFLGEAICPMKRNKLELLFWFPATSTFNFFFLFFLFFFVVVVVVVEFVSFFQYFFSQRLICYTLESIITLTLCLVGYEREKLKKEIYQVVNIKLIKGKKLKYLYNYYFIHLFIFIYFKKKDKRIVLIIILRI